MLTLCFGVARHLKCNAGDALGRAAALPVQGLTPARTFRREILVGSSNPRPELTVQNDFLQGEAMTSFPLSAIPATSRPVAGVTIPDSKLARELTELVKDTEVPLLFHHSSRVYYRGRSLAIAVVSALIQNFFMLAPCSTTWASPQACERA